MNRAYRQAGRTLRVFAAMVAAVGLMVLTASSASALTIGLVWNGDYGTAANEMEQVQRSGAAIFRMPIDSSLCKSPNWSPCDGIVQAAWEHGITVQPYVVRTNSSGETRFLLSEDSGWGTWGTWSREVVERYGVNGNFWAGKANPRPITAWEVWNEENLKKNNPLLPGAIEGVQPQNYGKFLKYTAEKLQAGSTNKTGHGTEVIFGGLYMPAGEYYNSFLQSASEVSGVPGSYVGVGIHPYAFQNGVTQMAERINDVRYGLDHNVPGAAGKPLWITEVGWPLGGTGAPSVSEAQQASLLTGSLDWIKGAAATDNIQIVDWYNIRDLGGQTGWSYFSGLRDVNGNYRSSWWAFQGETGAPKWPVASLPVSQDRDEPPGPHAVVEPGTNDVHVFYRTPSGKLGHNWYDMATHNGWGGEVLNASVASDPRPAIDNAGGINVFYRTSAGGLGHTWWEASTGKWGSELLTGEVAGEPDAIVEPGTNDVHVFYRTPSGKLGHNWYDMATHNGWGGEVLNASVTSNAHPIIDNAGGINVFYRTSAGGLGHTWWEASTGKWGSEVLTGEVASEPQPIVEPGTNDVHVFYRTPSGKLGHNWYDMATHSGWGGEVLNASVTSNAHPIIDNAGGINVFFRTSIGGLGHEWWEASAKEWRNEVLTGEVAATSPRAVTGSASEISDTKAKLNATVNPEGSLTSYYIEYGPTTAYGSKQPSLGENVALGYSDFAVSQTVSGLTAQTTYHYRVVATSPEGTSYGEDKTFKTEASGTTAAKLVNMPVTEPFDGSTESLANFGSKWSALGWAAGTTPKGQDTTSGWGPSSSYSTINGAYYTTALSGSELAAVATMATNPGTNTQRYFSLWLDMPTPASTRAGYELRFTNTATNTYEVKLAKWVGGVETVLASKTGYSFINGNSFAIVDQGGTVSAWTDTGSGFGQLLSALDSAFSSGNAGLHGAGNITRLAKFKAGSL